MTNEKKAMSDIQTQIEQLRDIANDRNYCNGRMCAAEYMMDEAADTMERMAAVVEAALEHHSCPRTDGECDRPLCVALAALDT